MPKNLLAVAAAVLLSNSFPAFAEARKADKIAIAAAPVSASVTAPAIVWPVVHAADMTAVHMTPGELPHAGEAVAQATPPPAPTLTVDIDLSSQRMTVSENGSQKYTWAISSARAGYRTPTGTFKPTWMSKMWYSRQYDMAPMPHSVFFSGGVAIHATQQVGMLGNPASHGCIRLAPRNAATFYALVNKHGKELTRIAVRGTPRANGPAMAGNRRNGQPRYAAMPGGYYVQAGGQGSYAYASPYGQQRGGYYPVQPGSGYGAKKQKFAQRGPVVRTSSSGFGYGFGGY